MFSNDMQGILGKDSFFLLLSKGTAGKNNPRRLLFFETTTEVRTKIIL
tara:strand:+ start:2101 stop:2244 length:144 start_codon:yes stop_codon:yes gene_type:complete